MSSFVVLIDSIYIILNTIQISFLLNMLFISLFMKRTHIQVFKKATHEARIKRVCLQADTLFFQSFVRSDITKYIQINTEIGR